MLRWKRIIPVAVLTLWPLAAQADILSSPHFRIDTDAATTFGGFGSSTNYRLTDSGGEAVVGAGSSGSYKLTGGYVATLAQNIQLNVQPNALAAYYPLDTGSGTAIYDVSANNYQGTIVGTPTWTTGKIGQALSFDGSTQYALAPTNANTNAETVTISAWIKTTSTSNSVFEKWSSSGSYPYSLRMSALGKVGFRAYDGTNNPATTSTTTVNDNNWHYVAGTRIKNGQMAIYVDGVQEATTTDNTSGSTTNASQVGIGARADGTVKYTGLVDEPKIYTRVLSPDEIKAEYNAQNAGVASGIAIPTVTPGVSQTALIDAVVRTDAAGYDLGIQQNHDLLHTDTTTTISPVSGSIASPIAWSEGSTKGLGFTLNAVTGSGNAIEGSWTGGTMFGAIPGSATTFHSRTGFTGGTPERNTVQLRLDVPTSQKSGAYSSTLTYTATLKP